MPIDRNKFIATQAPLPSTAGTFLDMILSKSSRLIIMLCQEEENLREQSESYWLSGTYISCNGLIEVELESEEALLNRSLIKRIINIRKGDKSLRTIQIQMLNWPDYGVPDLSDNGFETISNIIDAIDEIRSIFQEDPMTIHCSAGVGRTGTFLSLYWIVKCLKIQREWNYQNEQLSPFFNVFNTVRLLREQRYMMVSSVKQYMFIYEFIFEWIKKHFDIEVKRKEN